MPSPLRAIALYRIRPLRGVEPAFRRWLFRAARSSTFARRFGLGIMLAGWLLVFLPQAWIAAEVSHYILWEERPEGYDSILSDLDDGYASSYVAGWVISAILAALEVLIVRLIWIRFRAKHILRHRDSCAFCGHGIARVPLTAEHCITCPECARTTPTVEVWNEIDTTNPDRPTFRPASGMCPAFWTRRRLRLTARLAVAALALAALAYGGWWGIREIGIRREAAKARADLLSPEALNAKFVASLPPRQSEKPLIEDLVQQIATRAKTLSDEFRLAHPEIDAEGEYFPDASYISFRPDSSNDPKQDRARELSIELMHKFQANGLYDLLDQLPSADPWPNRRIPSSTTTDYEPLFGLGTARGVLRICIARMKLARENDDIAEFENGFAAGASIAAWLDQGPVLIDWLVATAADESLINGVQSVLSSRPDAEWLAVLERAFPALHPSSLAAVFDRERLYALNAIGRHFSEPSRVRQGLSAPEFQDGGELAWLQTMLNESIDDRPRRLGTYTENRTAAEAIYTTLIARADLEPFERRQLPPMSDHTGLVMMDASLTSLLYTFRSAERIALRHRTVKVMLALEQHRIRHGHYPSSLADLPPNSPAANIFDPFSGKPFGYRRIDAAADKHGRGYLLWTVGQDGIDNGGEADDRRWDAALRTSGEGKDMILNDPRW